jgi:hypothetical protein
VVVPPCLLEWTLNEKLVTLLLGGDVMVGRDVDTGAQRTGVVVEVILLEGSRPRYRIRNQAGQTWVVFWVGD